MRQPPGVEKRKRRRSRRTICHVQQKNPGWRNRGFLIRCRNNGGWLDDQPGGGPFGSMAPVSCARRVVAVSRYRVSQQDGLVHFFRRYQTRVECVAEPAECVTNDVVHFKCSVQTPGRIPYHPASYQWDSLLPVRWTGSIIPPFPTYFVM